MLTAAAPPAQQPLTYNLTMTVDVSKMKPLFKVYTEEEDGVNCNVSYSAAGYLVEVPCMPGTYLKVDLRFERIHKHPMIATADDYDENSFKILLDGESFGCVREGRGWYTFTAGFLGYDSADEKPDEIFIYFEGTEIIRFKVSPTLVE